MLINYDSHDAISQALARQFEAFAVRHSGGFFRGPAIASGQPVAVDGVVGASYTLTLNPHEPKGISGRIDGLPDGPRIWRPDFRNESGHLDAGVLLWASGGCYAEGPISLSGGDSWLFLKSVRLRWRRSLIEARVVAVRPLTLATGALRPEALAEVEIVVDSVYGRHALRVPVSDKLPPGCGRLQACGHLLVALRRFSFDTAAMTALLPADRLAVAVSNDCEVAA